MFACKYLFVLSVTIPFVFAAQNTPFQFPRRNGDVRYSNGGGGYTMQPVLNEAPSSPQMYIQYTRVPSPVHTESNPHVRETSKSGKHSKHSAEFPKPLLLSRSHRTSTQIPSPPAKSRIISDDDEDLDTRIARDKILRHRRQMSSQVGLQYTAGQMSSSSGSSSVSAESPFQSRKTTFTARPAFVSEAAIQMLTCGDLYCQDCRHAFRNPHTCYPNTQEEADHSPHARITSVAAAGHTRVPSISYKR